MNTIVLMGRLARDPETKLTSTQKGQTKVSRFPLVVKRNRTSKAFVVMITAYGNNAEFVEKYLEKGIKIALSGELVISQIKDEQTGTASYYTEVIMDNVEFAEAKTKKEESDGFQPAEKRKIPFDIPEELEFRRKNQYRTYDKRCTYDFHENNGRADKNENGSFSFGNNNGDDLMYV